MRSIEYLDRIDSTSSELVRRVRAGDRSAWDTVLVADHQTAGRGQQGRSWLDCGERPGASLLMSLLWDAHPALSLSGLSLVLGLALLESVRPIASEPARLRLKWPNDLLVGEAKAAGILIESLAVSGSHERAVVIGMGVNLCAIPSSGSGPQSLSMAAIDPDYRGDPRKLRARLLPELVERIERSLTRFAREGFAPYQPAYEAVLAWRGEPVVLESAGGGTLPGTLLGVNQDGALSLAAAGQTHTLHTGSLRPQPRMTLAAH